MKRFTYPLLLVLAAAVTAITACTGKSGNAKEDARILMQDSIDAHGLQRMQVSQSAVDIPFNGKTYHSSISRMPDDELPQVMSEMGDTFVDNKIVLRLTHAGGEVFNKTFTKSSFAPVIDNSFLGKSILEGIVYNTTTTQGIVYSASLCYPQTDLYVPVSITITATGNMTMTRQELLEDVYQSDSL